MKGLTEQQADGFVAAMKAEEGARVAANEIEIARLNMQSAAIEREMALLRLGRMRSEVADREALASERERRKKEHDGRLGTCICQ